jgi:hypothetical protein
VDETIKKLENSRTKNSTRSTRRGEDQEVSALDAYYHRRGDRSTAHWASLRDTDVSQLQRLRILAARQAP